MDKSIKIISSYTKVETFIHYECEYTHLSFQKKEKRVSHFVSLQPSLGMMKSFENV